MDINTQYYIKSNINLLEFVHKNPYLYKYLNRDPNYINSLNKLYKESLKNEFPSKINDFKNKLELLNTFIDIIN